MIRYSDTWAEVLHSRIVIILHLISWASPEDILMKREDADTSAVKLEQNSVRWQSDSTESSEHRSWSSVGTEVRAINSVCGTSGSVPTHSAPHQDTVNTSSDSPSISSTPVLRLNISKIPAIDPTSNGWEKKDISTAGPRVILAGKLSMNMKQNPGTGDMSELVWQHASENSGGTIRSMSDSKKQYKNGRLFSINNLFCQKYLTLQRFV